MDFPKEFTVNVTQKDIDEGVAEDCYACPIALAAMRATGCKGAGVSPYYLRLFYDNEEASYRLPRAAERFVLDFDEGKPVEPFSFTVTIYRHTSV